MMSCVDLLRNKLGQRRRKNTQENLREREEVSDEG
jgi:hypothetical protein